MFIVYNMIMKKSPLSSTLYHLPSFLILYPFIPPPLSSTPLSLLLYPLPLYPSSFILYPFIPSPLSSTPLSLLLYPLPFIPPPSVPIHLLCTLLSPPAIILQFSSSSRAALLHPLPLLGSTLKSLFSPSSPFFSLLACSPCGAILFNQKSYLCVIKYKKTI